MLNLVGQEVFVVSTDSIAVARCPPSSAGRAVLAFAGQVFWPGYVE